MVSDGSTWMKTSHYYSFENRINTYFERNCFTRKSLERIIQLDKKKVNCIHLITLTKICMMETWEKKSLEAEKEQNRFRFVSNDK